MKSKRREMSGNSGKFRGNKTPAGEYHPSRPHRSELPTEPKPAKPKRKGARIVCGAKAKSTGRPCKRWAKIGRDRCKYHGGGSLRGPAAPAYKHGFYSQALPGDVAKLARQAAADPELRGMKTGIALVDVRIRALCGSLESGTGPWDLAIGAFDRLTAAGDDLNAARSALDDLRKAITTGRTQERSWGELRELLQERDRLLTGETNRHKVTADTINADRVAAFMVGMIDALREESDDRDLLRRVFARWERLMGLAGVTGPAGTRT